MSRTYLDVFALRRRRRREVDGLWVMAGRVALALTVLLLLTPMVSSSFLYFVERPYRQAIPGLQEAWFRASLLVMVVLALDVHATVLRGQARDVLSLMPVEPRRVVVAELVPVVVCDVVPVWVGVVVPVLVGEVVVVAEVVGVVVGVTVLVLVGVAVPEVVGVVAVVADDVGGLVVVPVVVADVVTVDVVRSPPPHVQHAMVAVYPPFG